jgi:hypothetical protein
LVPLSNSCESYSSIKLLGVFSERLTINPLKLMREKVAGVAVVTTFNGGHKFEFKFPTREVRQAVPGPSSGKGRLSVSYS